MDSPILILLAGGKSTRMGFPKGLLNYHGTLWIVEQITRYKHIDNAKVFIGLGYDFQKYLDTIPWFKKALNNAYDHNGVEVRVVINNQPQLGSFSTLQTVLKNIDTQVMVLVQPIDVPLVNKDSLITIIRENNAIVIPNCTTKNGHPVKLKPEFWNTLLAVDTSSENARLDIQIKQINTSSIAYVNINDSSVYQNINTKEKWNNYCKSTI